MKHSELHQQKKFQTTIILIVISLVLLIYFLFTVGFKLILSVSTFIATITSKKTDTTVQKTNDQYGSVSIDSIPNATNSAKIFIGGSVVNFNQVLFYINGDKVKETSLSSSDNFLEEIGDLKKGNNEIFIKAKQSNSPMQKQTQVFSVLYKDEMPKLEISEPANDSKINKTEINVKGSTDKETYVRINEMPVVVDANGNFQTAISLKEGENVIQISAEDIAGNIEKKEIKIVYEKE